MADPGVSPAYLTARPVLAIDGTEDNGLGEGVLNLLVEETTEGLARCEITLGNWGESGSDDFFLYFQRDLLEFGRLLTVKLGEGQTGGPVFEGRIMGLEGHYPRTRAPEMVILAEDRFQDLRMTRRSRSFEDISDIEVIRQIAGEHGLQAEIDLDGPTYRVLAQLNQSDLAFIRERARAVDGEVWLQDDTLHAQSRSKRDAGTIEMTLGRGLLEFSVLADLAGQRTETVVSGWSVDSKEGIEYSADSSALSGELAGLDSGGSILADTIGDRVERLVHQGVRDDAEAQALATAHQNRIARAFVTGTGIAQGDARLLVGSHVTIQGLGPLFNGAYYVTESCHLFDTENGYRTRFRVERPGIGKP